MSRTRPIRQRLFRGGVQVDRCSKCGADAELAPIQLPGRYFDAQRVVTGQQVSREHERLISVARVIGFDVQRDGVRLNNGLISATEELGSQLDLDKTGRLVVDQQIQVHLVTEPVGRQQTADEDQQVV